MNDDQPPIDTTNKFGIGKRDDTFVFIRTLPQELSEDDALLVAAYIVAMSGNPGRWAAVLQAVCNT